MTEGNKPVGNPGGSAPKAEEHPPQHVPERGAKLRSRAEVEVSQVTSASTLQRDRVPGVQYPASSNQLPEDWEEQETPVQAAERKQREGVAKLSKGNTNLEAAAASGDAEVQELLARRAVAESNLDEAGVKGVDKKLAEVFGS